MAVMLTKGCEYALQAMLFLASKQSDAPVFQRDISVALNIPPHFLGKVLQMLTRSGLVLSQKGKSGGFSLGRPAEEITPSQIIDSVDGFRFMDGCFLGFPGCADETPCPVHSHWKEIKLSIMAMLENKNLGQLSEEMSSKLISIQQLLNTNPKKS